MQSDTSTAIPDRPTGKAELLARIGRARGELEQVIGPLDPARLDASDATGWSIKDHLAHLAAWQQSLLALLEGRDREAALGVRPGDTVDAEDIDALNAFIVARNRDRPAPEVLDDFRRTHQQVLAALGRLSDADLARPYAHFQPGDDDQRPVLGWIVGNTYDHDEGHLPAILALAGARGRGPGMRGGYHAR